MSGPTQPSSTYTQYEPSPFAKWYSKALMHPKSGLSIGLAESSRIAQTLQGVNKGNRKALKEFWGGYEPSAADFAAMQRGSTDFYAGRKQPTETKTAAQGGLMALRGYADGGKTKGKPLKEGEISFIQQMAKKMENGQSLTEAEQTRLNTIETRTGKNVSPYTDVGTIAPSNKKAAAAAEQISTYNAAPPPKPGEGQNKYSLANAMYGQIAGYDPTQTAYGGVTNEYGQKAIDYALNMQRPEEYGQASDIYRTAGAGLQNLAGYKPQDVSAERASAQQASAERASAAQMAAIADVQASQMAKPEDVVAQRLERYQMGETAPVTTEDLIAYQMAGPGSWTDEGVSSKYMSPYMQGVIDISKREAERDYQKQVNALNAKAISAGAFGGSRQALERSEAQRNYNQQLQDMQVKGLQQAYESGRSQYGQELNLSQQAALNNLQSKLSTQSQSSQQQLQAMLSNQNIDYQTKLQNLQAMLGVQSQEAAQMLNASLANQQAALTTNQTNASLAQQAALANQQTQFGVGSLNANLANQVALQNASLGTQASLQNAQLGTQTSWQNAQNALQASMANQQAGLQGNQQNIAAYGAMGNMASGLGSIGQYNANFNQQYLGNLGQLYNTTQGLQQSYLDKQQQNAINQQLGASNIDKYIAPGTAGGLMGNVGQGTQNLQ